VARSLRQPTRSHTRRYASHPESHGHDAHGSSQSAYHVAGGTSSGNEGYSVSSVPQQDPCIKPQQDQKANLRTCIDGLFCCPCGSAHFLHRIPARYRQELR
jgi:hypothetical protein